MEGTIRLVGMSEGRYLLGSLGDWDDDSECDHVIEDLLYLVSVLYGHFPVGMLDRGNGRVSPDDKGTGYVAYGIEGAREYLLQCSSVLDHCCGRVGCISWAGVRAVG